MKYIGAVVGILFLTACSDTVREHYATTEEARNAGLFERGWLPEIIPEDAYDIRSENELDLNISTGEFFLPGKDVEKFMALLEPYSGEPAEGLRTGVYSARDTVWEFMCDAGSGRCSYQSANSLQ